MKSSDIFVIVFLLSLAKLSSCQHDISIVCPPEIQELLANSDVAESGTVSSNCVLNVTHPFLSANRGFVAGEVYQITVDCFKLADYLYYTLATSEASPTASGSIKGNYQFFCDNNEAGVYVHSNITDSASQIRINWVAPTEEDVRCITIKVLLRTRVENNQNLFLKKEICRNPACYKIFHEAERTLSIDDNGPIGCWIFIEALPDKNVFVQILSFIHSNKSTDCFGLILSTNEIESSFTGRIRFCHGILMQNATDLYESGANGVIMLRYHVLENEKMFLKLRFFNQHKQGCNETIADEQSGVISSPNYPDDYFPGLDCYYTIVASPNDRIELTITEFSLQEPTHSVTNEDGFCSADYLSIAEGMANPMTVCGTFKNATSVGYCDNIRKFSTLEYCETIQTVSNVLVIHFHSDLTMENQGFKAIWRAIPSCSNRTVKNFSGVITSPNYPDNYLNNQYCTLKIVLPEYYFIQIQFEAFHLQPVDTFTDVCRIGEDYLQIGDEKICSNWNDRLDEMNVIFETNQLNFIFFSNQRLTGPGYKFSYR